MKSSILRMSALALLLSVETAFAGDIVVHADRLIDGIDNTPRANVSILIRNDRIVSVEPGFASPAGAEVIDLSKSTVLPGLIDCHVHITLQSDGGNPIVESVTRTNFDSAVRATTYARRTLLAGFTSVRDVGANAGGVTIALKNASPNALSTDRACGWRDQCSARPAAIAIIETASIRRSVFPAKRTTS
jgi:imidazolonepropionase-like amidohydrolase